MCAKICLVRTVIGDPIEADAIGRVFKARRTAAEPLYVYVVLNWQNFIYEANSFTTGEL